MLIILLLVIIFLFPCLANAQQNPKFYGLNQVKFIFPLDESVDKDVYFNRLKEKCKRHSDKDPTLIIPISISKSNFKPEIGDKLLVFKNSKCLGFTKVKYLYLDTASEEIVGPGEDEVRFETENKINNKSDNKYPLFVQIPKTTISKNVPTESKTIELSDREIEEAMDVVNEGNSGDFISGLKFFGQDLKVVVWDYAKNLSFALFQNGKWKKTMMPKGNAKYTFDQNFKVLGKNFIVLDWVTSGGMGLAVFRMDGGNVVKVYDVGYDYD